MTGLRDWLFDYSVKGIPNWLLLLGVFGQIVFFMRFLVQWLYSERKGRSVIPVAFWYFSIAGSCVLLLYGILRPEPIIILGQSFGFIVYGRNLRLIRKRGEKPGAEPDAKPRNKRFERVAVVLLLLAALTITGGVLWRKALRDHFVPRNFGVVTEGALYRSGRLTRNATRIIRDKHGIKTIVDLGAYHEGGAQDQSAARIAEELGLERHVFRLEGDATGDPNMYVAALRVMADPEKQPVHVQCSAGAQRTSAAVLLYRKIIEGEPVVRHYAETFRYKHKIEEWVLLAYLADWAGPIERAYRQGGTIPYQPPKRRRPPETPDASETSETPQAPPGAPPEEPPGAPSDHAPDA